MPISDYLRILRSRWYVVIAALVIGVVLAGLYVGTATKKYTSSAKLFVSTPSSDENLQQVSAGGTFAQDRVKSYATVADTPSILQPVITELHLPYTVSQLRGEVSASAPLNTVIIDLSVTDPDPARATAVVNEVASQLATFVGTLETPVGQTTSPVKATVIESASGPGGKTSPKTTLDVALGVLAGLVIGIGLALALELMDNRVNGHHDLEAIVEVPVVGLIGEDKLASTKPLIVVDDAFSRRAESFRALRTNVRYLGVERLRSMVVTSSVDTEGKSLTAANLAVALAQSGERVVLVDADLRRPTVAKTFGLPGGVGLTHVLVGEASLADAIQVWRQDLSLAILPAGRTPPNPSELLGSARLQEVLAELLSRCDLVIFDSPPLLPVTDAAVLTRATDGALVVARAKSTRIGQVEAAVAALRTADAEVLGLVINRIPKKRGGSAYGYGYGGYHSYGSYAPTTGTQSAPTPSDHSVVYPGPLERQAESRMSPADATSAKQAIETLGSSRSASRRS